MHRDLQAVAVSPHFPREGPHPRVARRIACEPRRFRGAGPDHCRSLANEVADFFKERRSHRLTLREDKHAVTHAVGEREPAVPHGHPRHEDIGGAAVEIVPAPLGRIPPNRG